MQTQHSPKSDQGAARETVMAATAEQVQPATRPEPDGAHAGGYRV